ncbi:uncharacterized protein [Arachis hypogaea]|uniref:uncharacterized protein n=1 Tax=Arachis hypogaea TaxID=3818 RepID=UPI003B21C30F
MYVVHHLLLQLKKILGILVIRSVDSSNAIERQIVHDLKKMLDNHNELAMSFHYARERFKNENSPDIKMKLIRNRVKDGRLYNLPTASEVSILIVGDIDESILDRDIIIEITSKKLQRIDVLHPLYLPLQYPLLFPYEEDGFRPGIETSVRHAKSEHLSFIRNNQPKLRVDKYSSLHESLVRGEANAVATGQHVCTVEFQKRGLPHAHILLFMDPKHTPKSPNDIDNMICAAIPDKLRRPKLYAAVEKFIVHGPCGRHNKNSPCMINGRCSKFYPKQFRRTTIIDEAGFPKYKRLDNGHTILKKNTVLDNSFIVPYNPSLLLKYGCHINVEHTCQTSAIKYLFKYISACEAAWRAFGYDIQQKESSIEGNLQANGRSLKEYDQMPLPTIDALDGIDDPLIMDEMNFDLSLLKEEYGGTGKTYLYKTLSAAIRSRGEIVLNVASCGIASLLLSNGRTTHSKFKISLDLNEDSVCCIKKPLDKCLRDILRYEKCYNPDMPFGGKVVLLGGDFRQILSVIPMDSHQDIVQSSINSSYLWKFCIVLKLTTNMRLTVGANHTQLRQISQFAEWLLTIGDGLAGDSTDGESEVNIPEDILIHNNEDGFNSLVNFVYLNLLLNLNNGSYFKDRIILAPTLDIVNDVNKHIMKSLIREEKTYLSSDSLCIEEGDKAGQVVLIPQMNMIPNNATIPFRFQRKQFPLVVSFSMTINKSQGQTLTTVGLYLPKFVFTDGQLYVALSRIKSKSDLKVLIKNNSSKTKDNTINIVYRKILKNLNDRI